MDRLTPKQAQLLRQLLPNDDDAAAQALRRQRHSELFAQELGDAMRTKRQATELDLANLGRKAVAVLGDALNGGAQSTVAVEAAGIVVERLLQLAHDEQVLLAELERRVGGLERRLTEIEKWWK
jgi:hypothetical protein